MLGLAFSGGKDSLACWYMYRAERPTVIFVNTGKAYPETLALVAMVRAASTEFIEVCSDQEAQIQREGLPSDVVPIDYTNAGFNITGAKSVKVQSYLGCCYENISRPLLDAAKRHGVTRLVRGQRAEERHKSPAVNGTVVEGIEFLHPIETWTRDQVMAYLHDKGPVPDHFGLNHSSLDCTDCTAFRRESIDRVAWMRKAHPELYAGYAVRALALHEAITEAMS